MSNRITTIYLEGGKKIVIDSGGSLYVKNGGSVEFEDGSAISTVAGGKIDVVENSALNVKSGGKIDIATGGVITAAGALNVKSGGKIDIATGGVITAAGTQAANIADLAITTDLTGVDTGTDMTAAQAAAIEADLASIATKLNAVLAALKGVGIISAT